MATASRLLLCLNEQFLVSQFFLKETKKICPNQPTYAESTDKNIPAFV